jgi:hypothetical protein
MPTPARSKLETGIPVLAIDKQMEGDPPNTRHGRSSPSHVTGIQPSSRYEDSLGLSLTGHRSVLPLPHDVHRSHILRPSRMLHSSSLTLSVAAATVLLTALAASSRELATAS